MVSILLKLTPTPRSPIASLRRAHYTGLRPVELRRSATAPVAPSISSRRGRRENLLDNNIRHDTISSEISGKRELLDWGTVAEGRRSYRRTEQRWLCRRRGPADDGRMDHAVASFVDAARLYVAEVQSDSNDLLPLLSSLGMLIATAHLLPDVEPASDEPGGRQSSRSNQDRTAHRRLYERLGPDASDYYRVIYYPLLDGIHDDDPPGMSIITEDLIEIYDDIRQGLEMFDNGQTIDAVWEWRFSFKVHWGLHATDVLRVLHRSAFS